MGRSFDIPTKDGSEIDGKSNMSNVERWKQLFQFVFDILNRETYFDRYGPYALVPMANGTITSVLYSILIRKL